MGTPQKSHPFHSSLLSSLFPLPLAGDQKMPIPILPFLLLLHVTSPASSLPGPDPATIHPLTLPPPHSVIPAFPEQSALPDDPCPHLSLPEELLRNVKSACGPHASQRTRCCPVLAAWLYSSYSSSALRPPSSNVSVDVPTLPDDSETCVKGVEDRIRARGVELFRPNETCDLVYCYCGIRLHPLTCPEVFRVNKRGRLVGDRRVRRLERSCSGGASAGDVGRFPGLGGCSKCLTTLSSLTSNKTSTTSKQPDERTIKMHDKDCQLMGLTWLLSKNRTAYIPTVSAVLRAMMMSPDGSNQQSCTLSSDGMPLAVDSSQFSGGSASISRRGWTQMSLVLICIHLLCKI